MTFDEYPPRCPRCQEDLWDLQTLAVAAERVLQSTSPLGLAMLELNETTMTARRALCCHLGLCRGDVNMPRPEAEPAVLVVDASSGDPLSPAVAGPAHACPDCARPRLSLYELIRRCYSDLSSARRARTPVQAVEVLRAGAARNAASLRCHVGLCGSAPLPALGAGRFLVAQPCASRGASRTQTVIGTCY